MAKRGGARAGESGGTRPAFPRLERVDRRYRLDLGTGQSCPLVVRSPDLSAVLAEAVREEVEDNLLIRLSRLESGEGNRVVADYGRLIALMKPEIVPYPGQAEVKAARHLIRHEADVPVLLSAIASRPDWFLTHNAKHFTPAIARRTGLRFATPVEFFRALSKSIAGEHRG